MDTIRLRTLTLKSKLGFGKYHDFTIGDIIVMGKEDYLRWVYFNSNLITFVDDILEIIKIPKRKFRLKKPNKNPALHKELNRKLFDKLGKKARLDFYKKRANNMKNKRIEKSNINKSKNLFYSKSFMQSKNQGVLS